jgi:hypothetical protein
MSARDEAEKKLRAAAESFLATQQEKLDKLEQEYKANPTNHAAGELLIQATSSHCSAGLWG